MKVYGRHATANSIKTSSGRVKTKLKHDLDVWIFIYLFGVIWDCFNYALFHASVADPGFPGGGGRGPATQALFGENVCKNERIRSRRGACVRHAP